MNKILILLSIFSLFLFSKPEKLIVGIWKLTDFEVIGMDKFAEWYISQSLPLIEKKILKIHDEIALKEAESLGLTSQNEIDEKYSELQELQRELEEQIIEKENLTNEKVIEQFLIINEKLLQFDYNLFFYNDKTFKFDFFPYESGTWKIKSKNNLILTNKNKKETNYIISEISENKMILKTTTELTSFSIDYIMTFEKNKTI